MPDGWPVAEIPPRARGRGDPKGWHPLLYGNTPACAGKSALILDRMPTPRKYPRVRGEEMVFSLFLQKPLEIPPRARGRASYARIACWHFGNTSACAGKSPQTRPEARSCRKYPRVRGEECEVECAGHFRLEIPPRARGRDCVCKWPCYCRKYPRVRGEERDPLIAVVQAAEIPPRARGRAQKTGSRIKKNGNTPACAGKSAPD